MILNDRENPEQIPGAQNTGRIEGIITEQGLISDERKEVNLESYRRVTALGQILKDLDFPANKNKIIEFVKDYVNDKELLEKLEIIEDKEYKNAEEVTIAASIAS